MVRHYKPTGRPRGRPRKQFDVPLTSYGIKTGDELMGGLGIAFSDWSEFAAHLPTAADLQRAMEVAAEGVGRLESSESANAPAVPASKRRARELGTGLKKSAPPNPDEKT